MDKKRPEFFPTGLFTVGIVGEKKNYNLQPGVTEYELWSASTVEWVPDAE